MVEAPGQYAAPVWSIRGDPMALTPADIHNVAFKKPSIGKRGYDEDEVDAFLDLLEAELTRLIEENNDLKAQVEDMQRSGPPGPRRPVPPPEQMPPPPPVQSRIDENQVVKVLAMAQETAEKYVADAKTEADRMVGEARAAADRMIGEARGKADAMMAEARTRSDAVGREARGKAAALTQEAERKHNEIIGGLERPKTTLENRIEELRTFEREYRTRLKSYLESQLRDLEGRGSAEPATTAAGAAVSADGYGMQGDSGDGRATGSPAAGPEVP
jgi:DivIVA domain-containing protein